MSSGDMPFPREAFLFVGDGPLASAVQYVSRDCDNIVWLGEIENHKLRIAYGLQT